MAEDSDVREHQGEGAAEEPKHSWGPADWIALPVITAIAFVARIVHLSYPPSVIFDETYYAKDACWYLYSNASKCMLTSPGEQSYVHPPLAKWLIALGIRIFGMNSFGWRISAVIAGTVTVALLYLLARKILHSTLGAIVVSGLLAIDILHFVQSRVAMLDGFVPLFGVAMFLFVVYDRDRMISDSGAARAAPDLEPTDPQEIHRMEGDQDLPPGPAWKWRLHLLDRPWRLAAGIAAGAAVASKWSGGLLFVAALLLTVAWEIASRRRAAAGTASAGFWRAAGIAFVDEAPSIILWMVVVPALVYTATFIGRLEGPVLCQCYSTSQNWFVRFWNDNKWMYQFQKSLTATHNYESPPWSWMLLKRPVSYFFCAGTSCSPAVGASGNQEIMAFGDPFVWWSSGLALLFVAWRWVKERNFSGAEGLILTGFFITYLPWFKLAAGRPAVFIFYFVPTIPFMCLALGYVATKIGRSWEAKTSVAVFAAASIGLFAFYYPLAAGATISETARTQRVWIFDDCTKPPTFNFTTTATVTQNGSPTAVPTVTPTDSAAIPPGYGESWTQGWCWI